MSDQATRQTGRSPLARIIGVRILGTGSFLPPRVVTNQELHEKYGIDPRWIVQRTGIHERRMCAPDMATGDMCVEAGRRAIENSGVDPAEIDLVIVATFTPDSPLPSTGCRVQQRLGIRAPAFDMQAACSGFMYGLVTGMQFVAGGCARHALVIGAETISRVVNMADHRTLPLFGDGAGAAIVGRGSSEQGFVSYTLGADGSGEDLIVQPMGGSRMPPSCAAIQHNLQYIQMDGRAVFKWAIRLVCDTVQDVISAAGVTFDDVALFIPHQANVRIIDAAADLLKVDRRKIFLNLQRYGNTSAASIPIALDEACAQGRVRPGDLILMSGFGAGLTWGTGLLRW
ncbi:MAG: ketoacyl-ACP synthase III [Planctomycetia bacterium]|nr:ketoacyl-ACP synthase III [Planctomycetia bacterium]